MAPGTKRKRGDRTYSHDSHDGASRPSPHRPEELGLAYQGRSQGQYSHHHGQGPHSPSYSQHPGGRGGRRNARGRRNSGIHGQQPNGAMNNDDRGSRRRESTDQDRSAAARSANAAPPADSVLSPPSNPHLNGTPAPVQQLTTTAPSSQPQLPVPSPRPYQYKIITGDRLKSWPDSGRTSVIEELVATYKGQDPIAISIVFQEILRAGLDGRIEAAEAGKLIADSFAAEPLEGDVDLPDLFLDTLSILTEYEPSHPRAQPLVLATGISLTLMREVLEMPLLKTLGLIRPTFDRMFIRKQTNILYKQSNYNLLREETEGYSKLVTELFTTTNSEPPTAEVVEDTFENIKALIGAFDLDAGRVLDVTLDVFASLLVKHYRFFVKLLRTSSWWPHEQSYGLQTEGQGFGSLPPWAQPDHSSWLVTEDEKAEIALMKVQRDQQFWERAREVGMDAYFELGGRRILDHSDVESLINIAIPINPQENEDKSTEEKRIEETREWVKITKTLPPAGNPVAAQLLGFKLRFYASAARDVHDALPVNLIYLAALLIKIGFISLRDLYPHLFPDDGSMTAGVKEKMMKEKEEREMAKRPGGGAMNALARAGALADDTLPPAAVGRLRETTTRASTPSRSEPSGAKTDTSTSKLEEEEKEALPEPSDQKVQLLRSLLCIGAIPESLYILGRFTWLPDAFPDLPDHINRLLHHSLQKIYEPLRPLPQCDGIREAAQIPAIEQAGVSKGDLKLQDAPTPKTLRWAQLDKNDVDGIDYRFYWDDWSDNIPVCQNVDDVFTLCGTLMNLSGVKIGQDSALLVKLARIGKYSLGEDFSQANQARWIDLCKRLLAPALSLTKSNPGVVTEVYDLLKLFSTPTRYSIYNEWFMGATSRLPDLENAFALTRAETKDILRRMTKTNQRLMARNLAKVACGSPGVVFQVVFGQIESYQNLIDVVIECARYFTYMGYDILTWALLSSLGKAGRSRVSETGTNVSQWLTSLARFSGKVSKRYSILNSLPLLQYVLQQLCKDNSADLQVLRELIYNMTGIAPDTDFTDAQVQAMAGGELLQGQILQQLQDKRHESKVAGKRLMKTIVDHDLTGSLLVAIAQQRQRCMFTENLNQLKAIGENFDSVHIVLTQYYDMLRHNLSVKEFDQLVPDLCSLISDFGVEPSIAFMIHRKSIVKAMEEYDAAHPPVKKRNSESSKVNVHAEKTDALQSSGETGTSKIIEDIEMVEAPRADSQVQRTTGADAISATESDPESKKSLAENSSVSLTELVTTVEVEGKVEDELSSDQLATKTAVVSDNQPPFKWHPVIQEIIDKIKNVLPVDFETSMSLPFYVSFWQLSLNDLTLPTQSYNEEISRQKEQLATINADRSDMSATGIQKREKDKKAVNEFLSRLTEEMKNSVSRHSHVRQRLDKEKQHWFQGFSGQGQALINALIQECLLPRMLMSPLDSQYTWRMFNMLHSSGTPRFRTMFILDRLFDEKVFSNVMFHCTGREVENFARFLSELLKELGSWHASRAEYEKRAFGPKKTLIGFAKQLTQDGKAETLVNYEEFRSLLHKWHLHICQALVSALQTDEHMHIRNACVVLRAIVRNFPVVNWMGKKLLQILTQISKEEEAKRAVDRREDVWVLSTSVLGNLMAREKHWVLPQAFHVNNPSMKSQGKTSRAQSTGPKSPQPETTAPSQSLNAEAPSFEPKTGKLIDGGRITSNSGKTEVEDGELEDMVMADVKVAETAVEESSEAEPNAATQSALTKELKSEGKKDEFAEMRARVKASADANRRQSQPASGNTKPALNDGEAANAASPVQAAPNNSASQSTGSTAPSSNEGRSTPAAGAQKTTPNIPARPELTGGNSTPTPATSDRQPHALPSRPDPQASQRTRYPPRQHDGTSGGALDRPDSRGRSFQDAQRLDRPGEVTQQRHNTDRGGQPANRPDNRAGYQRSDSSARYPDTGHQDDRGYRQASEFSGRPPSTDMRPAGRELMDSRPMSARDERSEPHQGPSSRYESYAGPNQTPSRGSASVPPPPSELDHSINPERAARIYQTESSERPNSYSRPPATFSRHDGSSGMPRPRSRSPMRGEGRPRDGRSEAARPSYETRSQRDAATEHVPNGPRNAPPHRHGYATEGQSRSDLMQPPPSRSYHERSNGRFPQDYAPRPQPRHQEDNYGRLNADPGTPQAPPDSSPPNERSVRNTNGGSMPATRRQSSGAPGPSLSVGPDQSHPLSDATTDRHTQHPASQASSSVPQTPVSVDPELDLSGIHPSRLEQFNQGKPNAPPVQISEVSTQNSQPQSQAPPSGPRSTQPRGPETPTSAGSNQSPAPRNAPAGPANTGDRRNRDGSARRQFAEMQQTLSQSGQPSSSGPGMSPNVRGSAEQGTSIRGRANAGRQQQQPLSSVQPPPGTGAMQNGHADAAEFSREQPGSQQSQSQAQMPSAPNPGAPPPSDRPEREGANLRGGGNAAGRERERSPQREQRDRSDVSREFRERDEPAPRSHRGSREQSRDTRADQENRDREGPRERGKEHGRSIRGSGADREREQREAAGGRPSGYETRHRGTERERDRNRERERREPAYPPRGSGGGGGAAWSGPEPHAGSGPGNRRGDGRERREVSGQKRAWNPEEGSGGGGAKRQRRGGN